MVQLLFSYGCTTNTPTEALPEQVFPVTDGKERRQHQKAIGSSEASGTRRGCSQASRVCQEQKNEARGKDEEGDMQGDVQGEAEERGEREEREERGEGKGGGKQGRIATEEREIYEG